MPRKARTRAESGIYHVMLRGINCQQIFADEEDNKVFLEILQSGDGSLIEAFRRLGHQLQIRPLLIAALHILPPGFFH